MTDHENDEFSDDSIEDETLEEGNEEEETTPGKKNKSNFSNLYKKAKELESSLSEKDRLLAEKEEELEALRNSDPDAVEEIKKGKEVDDLRFSIFTLENPDAKPHLDAIKAIMKEYGIDNTKAWKLVKMDLPEESRTKTDFSIWKTSFSTKDLSKVSPEDALKLSPEKQREWRAINLW